MCCNINCFKLICWHTLTAARCLATVFMTLPTVMAVIINVTVVVNVTNIAFYYFPDFLLLTVECLLCYILTKSNSVPVCLKKRQRLPVMCQFWCIGGEDV
jgi:hypothetical protein